VSVSEPDPAAQTEEFARRGVSVIVPAHEAEATLGAALESILAQEYRPLEVIVVDDASSDGTSDVARGYADRGVRVLRLERNAGPAAARNAGLERAQGRYLAFLDADDVWLPGKVAKQVALLEERAERKLVTCDSEYVSQAGTHLRRSHESRPPAAGADAWKTLLRYNYSPTPTVMVRREEALAAGGFDPAIRFGEDLDLWIRLALTGEVAVLSEVLVRIVEWPGSVTGRSGEGEADYVLPFVERYVAQQRARLTGEEARAILGRRLFDSGVCLLYSRKPARSLGYFLRALGQRYQPRETARYLPRVLLSILTGGRYPWRDFGRAGGADA
jgi:glycosyltransferase involved in cell wall biosynthesis